MKSNSVYTFLSAFSFLVVVLATSVLVALIGTGALFILTESLRMRSIPEWMLSSVFYLLLCLGACGFIFLTRKVRKKQSDQPETRSRVQSIILWETFALLLFLLFSYVSWLTDYFVPGLIGLISPLVCLVLALVWPFSCRQTSFWKAIRILGLLIAFYLLAIGGFILGRSGEKVSYQGNNRVEIPRAVQWLADAYIPEGATDIKLEGSSINCDWSCQVSEEVFLKWKADFRYSDEFETVDNPRNFSDKGPFPYFRYGYRRADGGGITLKYHPETQTMTGWYSHH